MFFIRKILILIITQFLSEYAIYFVLNLCIPNIIKKRAYVTYLFELHAKYILRWYKIVCAFSIFMGGIPINYRVMKIAYVTFVSAKRYYFLIINLENNKKFYFNNFDS